MRYTRTLLYVCFKTFIKLFLCIVQVRQVENKIDTNKIKKHDIVRLYSGETVEIVEITETQLLGRFAPHPNNTSDKIEKWDRRTGEYLCPVEGFKIFPNPYFTQYKHVYDIRRIVKHAMVK